MAEWTLAGKARNDFADMIEALEPEQLEAQSWCSEWTAHGVLAHVTSFVETGGFELFGLMIKSGFKFEKVSMAMVDKRMDRSAAELSAALRSLATKSAPLPTFPEQMTVADVAIHMQDVRRPLGLAGELDTDVVRASLDFLTTHKLAKTLVDGRPLDNVKLEASDLAWSFGEGDAIAGTGEALMMAIANRPVLGDLTGPGLRHWS